MKPEFIQAMLQFEEQQRINHWQTSGYAAHLAFGGLYEAISDLNDRFIETTMGTENAKVAFTGSLCLELTPFTDVVAASSQIAAYRDFINIELMRSVMDADRLNILADMAEACNKALYMLSLT